VLLYLFYVREVLLEGTPKSLTAFFTAYCLAHFYLLKKSAKVLHCFGLDCGMLVLKIFYSSRDQKPVPVVDDFFKAYPMMPLSCRSDLAGR
jgi:hypothetical protein